MIMSQLTNITLSTVAVKKAGEASGLMTTIRTLGGSLGTAIVGTIMLSTLISGITSRVESNEIIPGPAKAEIVKKINTEGQQWEGYDTSGQSSAPDPINNEIAEISAQATVEANRDALKYSAIFTILTFIVTFLMPRRIMDNENKTVVDKSKQEC